MLVKDIAAALNAKVIGDENIEIRCVANLKTAKADEISFLSDPKYKDDLSESKAGAVIIKESELAHCNCTALIMADPYVGFARVAQLLDTTPAIAKGIHPTAQVEEGVTLGENVGIGPYVSIKRGAKIGNNVQLGANVTIGDNVVIGDNTKIYPNCSIYHDCIIGSACLFQSGVVIGSDGFGYANEKGEWIKIPQQGRVVIGNRVEIGANTCVDRGAIDDTVIEDNVIIDNLCQIAHNDRIGYGTAIAGCTTVAGSVTIGKYCIIGGKTVINGHISICDGVTITGASGVMRGIDKPGVYSSVIPTVPNKEWRLNTARFLHLNDMYRKLMDLEKKVKILEEK